MSYKSAVQKKPPLVLVPPLMSPGLHADLFHVYLAKDDTPRIAPVLARKWYGDRRFFMHLVMEAVRLKNLSGMRYLTAQMRKSGTTPDAHGADVAIRARHWHIVNYLLHLQCPVSITSLYEFVNRTDTYSPLLAHLVHRMSTADRTRYGPSLMQAVFYGPNGRERCASRATIALLRAISKHTGTQPNTFTLLLLSPWERTAFAAGKHLNALMTAPSSLIPEGVLGCFVDTTPPSVAAAPARELIKKQ